MASVTYIGHLGDKTTALRFLRGFGPLKQLVIKNGHGLLVSASFAKSDKKSFFENFWRGWF